MTIEILTNEPLSEQHAYAVIAAIVMAFFTAAIVAAVCVTVAEMMTDAVRAAAGCE